MSGTQTLVLLFVAVALLGLGYGISYVVLKSRMPEESWVKLAKIIKRSSQVWGKVYTVKQAQFFAKALYEGLKLDASSGYTLEEFTEMFLYLVPVQNPPDAYVAVPESVLMSSPDDDPLLAQIDDIMVKAIRDLEAQPA